MQAILQKHVPAPSFDYCLALWHQHQFDFKVTRPRQSKFGDFRVRPGQRACITINNDRNPYGFLITYLHEIAHLVTYRANQKKRVAPHGKEWKANFRQLLIPVLDVTVFPVSILVPLLRYAQNPKASTASDGPLMLALQVYQAEAAPGLSNADHGVPLNQIAEGEVFSFRQKTFVRGTLRRTRYVVVEPMSKKQFLIPAHALVKKV